MTSVLGPALGRAAERLVADGPVGAEREQQLGDLASPGHRCPVERRRAVIERRSGARVLVVEPISRRLSPWWPAWAEAFASAGGRADEWRFSAALRPTQQQLARASGLDPRELTARSLFA